MARILKNWLESYLAYTDDSEPPLSYHTWTGIGILAGALQRRVYITQATKHIYPNLYIVLVGPSGMVRKGTAFDYAKPLISAINIPHMMGAITLEKLIRRMNLAITNFVDRTSGSPKFQCGMFCLSEELAVFLGEGNVRFLADLCNWFDCPDYWEYDTKHAGTDKLDGVYFTLVAACAPDWIPHIIPRVAIGGGFTSRVIWVVEERPRKIVPNPEFNEELQGLLIKDLEEILLLSGHYVFSPEAQREYDSWYLETQQAVMDGILAIPDPKFAGYCSRRATLLKKLSIIMTVSECNESEIQPHHLKQALYHLQEVEMKMPRAFQGVGEARYVYATELILNYLALHQKATRSQILTFFFRDIDAWTFEVVSKTLYMRGIIEQEPIKVKGRSDLLVTLLNQPSVQDLNSSLEESEEEDEQSED